MAFSNDTGLHVAYLGPPSSYTHQATVEDFDQDAFVLEPRSTIHDVFVAVQSGLSSYGVVPFENSTNGSVVQTLDLFADRESQCPDVYVCGEAFLPVSHYLLGYSSGIRHDALSVSGEATPTSKSPTPLKPRSHPLTDLRHVRRIYSHPQAFGQSEAFLSTYLKGAERQEVTSTSRAAEMVAKDQSRTTAAISSKMAASVYGLDVLARGVQDRADNMTRFFFLRRCAGPDDGPRPPFLRDGGEGQKWKTLVAFTIDHSKPGALADVLSVFKTYGLNFTSINSRPSRLKPWHYVFFVEFEARREEGGKGAVNEALARLRDLTEGCRWHGSWRNRNRGRGG